MIEGLKEAEKNVDLTAMEPYVQGFMAAHPEDASIGLHNLEEAAKALDDGRTFMKIMFLQLEAARRDYDIYMEKGIPVEESVWETVLKL